MNELPAAAVERLSDRQRQCLRLVYSGYRSDKEIAQKLGIAPDTVKQHIAAARRTLGVSTRSQAARILARHEAAGDGVDTPPPEGGNPSDRLVSGASVGSVQSSSRAWRRRLGPIGWLVPAEKGAPNNLTSVQRLLIIVALPLIIIMILVGALASFETLSRLVRFLLL